MQAGAKFAVPCVATTSSGLRPGRWVLRYCQMMDKCGYKKGRLFTMARPGRASHQPLLVHFEDLFYSTIEAIQAQRNSLIKPEVVVREIYGIFRTLRRGATAHATNRRIDPELRKAINWWHSEFVAYQKGKIASLSLPEIYAQLNYIKEFVLGFSEAF